MEGYYGNAIPRNEWMAAQNEVNNIFQFTVKLYSINGTLEENATDLV